MPPTASAYISLTGKNLLCRRNVGGFSFTVFWKSNSRDYVMTMFMTRLYRIKCHWNPPLTMPGCSATLAWSPKSVGPLFNFYIMPRQKKWKGKQIWTGKLAIWPITNRHVADYLDNSFLRISIIKLNWNLLKVYSALASLIFVALPFQAMPDLKTNRVWNTNRLMN